MRHFKASLIVGIISSLLVLGLCSMEAFKPFDKALLEFLGPGISRPLLLDTVVGFVVLAYAFGIAWVTIDVIRFPLKIAVAAAAFLQVLSLPWVLALYQIYLPPFAPAVTILLSLGFGILYSRGKKGGRKRVYRHLFGERISRQDFNALVNSDKPPKLEGEMREASVLVCKAFNVEELREAMSAEDYVTLNNLFLDLSAALLLERGACVDECGGDGLRVIFGAPLPDSMHAAAACKAALELAQRLDVLNHELDAIKRNFTRN